MKKKTPSKSKEPRSGIPPGPTPVGLFWLLAKINSVTLGGGYVIVPVMASSLEKKGWMTEKDFYDIFARAQAFPGPLALSSAILVSIRLCGWAGVVAAFFGVVLPPFIALILVSGALAKVGSLPAVQRFLEGAGAVVPGLVAAMIYKTATKRTWTPLRVAETMALAVLLIFMPAYSLPILLLAIAIFYCTEGLCKRSK
ncbi:MAG TPA: chromate transporter [Rectinemataceae bacterium]|nr:chromate transporter [Rectinemataceae bacterium]